MYDGQIGATSGAGKSGETFFFYFVFCLFRAASMAYGDSQARGRIGATAAGLHKSHSNTGSEPCLRAIPQLMATPDP